MNKLFFYLTILAVFATTVTLILGLFNLFSTQKGKTLKSNQLMRWRILFQLAALLVFSALLLLNKNLPSP